MRRIFLALTALALATALLSGVISEVSQQSSGSYDPWVDLNDDGTIDIFDVVRVALAFGTSGTAFAAKAALRYDSGWIDIRDQQGQYINVTHNLNLTGSSMLRIAGKTLLDEQAHVRFYNEAGQPAGWNRTYAAFGEAASVVQTSEGGYAVAGSDYLFKTDADGKLEWNQTFDPSVIFSVYSMVQTSDGGYALAGHKTSDDIFGSPDFALVKTDANGTMQWHQSYGWLAVEWANSVVQTADGGYALAGRGAWVGVDCFMVKTDANGAMQWNRTFGDPAYHEEVTSIVQTDDGGYALAGYSDRSGLWRFLLMKADGSGNMQWNQSYCEPGESSQAYSVIQTSDGGYALAGNTSGSSAFYLVKTDTEGTTEWARRLSTNQTSVAVPYSVVQTSDGGYALAGRRILSVNWPQYCDFYLVRTDPDGYLLWNRWYGFGKVAYSVVQTSDGGYALAGSEGSGFCYVVKTDVHGQVEDSGVGLTLAGQNANTVRLYRGSTDSYWNFVRVQIWAIKETP